MGTVLIVINYASRWSWSRVRNFQGTSLELSVGNTADLAETSSNGNKIKELLASRSVGLCNILSVPAALNRVPYLKCTWMCSWGYSDRIKRSVWTVKLLSCCVTNWQVKGIHVQVTNNGAAFDVGFPPHAIRHVMLRIFKLLWMSRSNQMHVSKTGLMGWWVTGD